MITYNLERFDFPYVQAVQSLCDVCDQVVVLDCGSTDGTLQKLQEGVIRNRNMDLYLDGDWNCRDDRRRLPMLANMALSRLQTEWHIGLQADEVIHESSYDTIHEAIGAVRGEGYGIRRLNLWGSMDTCFRFDYSQKPCSDVVIRIGKTRYPFYGDAESLAVHNPQFDFVDRIVTFHYSYVRKPDVGLDKAIWMTGWFWGTGQPDPKLVEQKRNYGLFKALEIHPASALQPIPMQHPAYMKGWVEERRPMLEALQ